MALIGSITGSLTKLTDGTSYLVAGPGISIVTGTNGEVTITNDGTIGDITAVTAGTGLSGGGSSGAVTLNINDSVVATVSGTSFSGAVKAFSGLTGSLTKLTDGTSYLIAGNNVTITTGSSGAVTIASTATGGGESYFSSTTAGSIFTSGSAAIRGAESAIDSPADKGTDIFFYVSGSSGTKGGATPGVAMFGGDVVVSGTIYGGVAFGTSTSLTLRSSKVQITANSLSQGQSGGNDVSFFASGSVGSKGGSTPGTSLFGGDVVVSGTLYNGSGVAYSAGATSATGTFNDGGAAFATTASVSFAGSHTNGMTYFASRSAGAISTGADVFFYVSGTARQGHNPSFSQLAKRALFNGDIVTSGTLQMLGAGYTTTIGTDTFLFVSGGIGTKGITSLRGASVFAGDLVISGNTHLATAVESMATTGSALQGTLTFNTAGQSIFYVSGTAGNITANFTNVPTGSGAVISTNVILSQSSMGGGIVSALQINSVASTILWANGVTPTANAGKHDVFGFSLIRSGTIWTTLGQMSTYG